MASCSNYGIERLCKGCVAAWKGGESDAKAEMGLGDLHFARTSSVMISISNGTLHQ
jgi:hypothetical protein